METPLAGNRAAAGLHLITRNDIDQRLLWETEMDFTTAGPEAAPTSFRFSARRVDTPYSFRYIGLNLWIGRL